MCNYNEYESDELLEIVESQLESLAIAINSWDRNNIEDLQQAIVELIAYSHSEEYQLALGDDGLNIWEHANVNVADLPQGLIIPYEIDTTGIWACDRRGYCLVGDSLPGEVMTLADAVQIYNHHTH